MAFATSFAVAIRFSGVVSIADFTNSSCPAIHRVCATPGATAFTRISGAWLMAIDFVNEMTAALDAQ